MDQQDAWDISPQQSDGSVPNVSKRAWSDIRSGIAIIAWFAMYSTFYPLTRTVIGFMDTDYSMDEQVRVLIAVVVAALLSSFILSAARGAQD